MPKIVLAIPDLDVTVTRPVVYDVVRQLIELTKIDPKTLIYYPDNLEQMRQHDTAIGETTEKNQFGNAPSIVIEVTETPLEEETNINYPLGEENYLITHDPRLSVQMRPTYVFTEINVSIRLRSKDIVSARRWRDTVRNRVMQGRQAFVHDVDYSYRLPPEFILVLLEIHRLRESNVGYGEDFKTWLTTNSTRRLTVGTNQNASASELLVAESLRRVQGWFDFVVTPDDSEKTDNTSNREVSFNYIFQFDKPTNVLLDYPIVVHNQLLSSMYRETESVVERENHREYLAHYKTGMRYFEAVTPFRDNYWRKGVTIPSFDDFVPASVPIATLPIVTALIKLTGTEPGTVLINLKNLGRYKLKPHVLEFLSTEHESLSRHYGCILQIQVYRNNHVMRDFGESFEVTKDLDVVSKVPLSERDIHHVRLAAVSDWTLLNGDALDRGRENAKTIINVIKVIRPDIDTSKIKPYGPTVDNELIGGIVPKKDIEDIINIDVDHNNTRQFNIVSTFFVQSHRK